MPRIYVPKLPEFEPVARFAKTLPGVTVTETASGYFVVESGHDIVLRRRDMGFKPAVWYTCLSGGIDGRIADFGRDEVRITAA
ncbi:MAG: hypothetical protein KIT16_10275 [Rhodospirillaceae bacterium]|nr:hypothetical protein [Rhodospirillaceae bacterium]